MLQICNMEGIGSIPARASAEPAVGGDRDARIAPVERAHLVDDIRGKYDDLARLEAHLARARRECRPQRPIPRIEVAAGPGPGVEGPEQSAPRPVGGGLARAHAVD